MNKITTEDIKKKKGRGRVTMLTCYDFSFAKVLDEAGLDMILVGDSLANVVLGMSETRKISIAEMLNHTKAVAKAVKNSLVVADMPYKAYQKDPQKCVYYAKKFISAGAEAVKIEWFKNCPQVVKKIVKAKIPVMGHIGLTPQTAHLLGGYKVQGKKPEEVTNLLKQAKILQDLGIFSLVLECIPSQVSRLITKSVQMPTIGIGAGKYCDGQVLVLYDFLGLYKGKKLKFVRPYADFFSQTKQAVSNFIKDVKKTNFPAKKESFD
ncbi:MAG: 3-methyl-2-oxobutanoate hydroxymethyltransferase [Candidatus Omnitrophota bacterium]